MIKNINNTMHVVGISSVVVAEKGLRATCMDYVSDVLPELIAQHDIAVESIDLILTLSTSIDYLSEHKDIQTPRLGYPVQKQLAANNAFVIDLQDTSWAQAFEVANGYLSGTDMSNVLVIEANSFEKNIVEQLFTGARAALLSKSNIVNQVHMVVNTLGEGEPRTLSHVESNLLLSDSNENEVAMLQKTIETIMEQFRSSTKPLLLDLPPYLSANVQGELQTKYPDKCWWTWDTLRENPENVVWLSYEVFRNRVVAREVFVKGDL